MAYGGAMRHGVDDTGKEQQTQTGRERRESRRQARMPGVTAFNYFNYFTEIEEYFWRKRGAQILVSPLDWAILESWQKANIPVEVVLKGIDNAFESYGRSRRGLSGRPLKSLAYCVDAVLDAAVEAEEARAGHGPEVQAAGRRGAGAGAPQPFAADELREYLAHNAARLREAANTPGMRQPQTAEGESLARRLADTVKQLDNCRAKFDAETIGDLEDLERRLTVLEDALYAAVQAGADTDTLLEIRREMDRQLSPYRRKMTAEQLAMLEQQYMRRRLFEAYGLPRLSLFYLT